MTKVKEENQEFIKEVYSSLAVIEQLEETIGKLMDFSGTLDGSSQTELRLYIERLKSTVELLDGNSEPFNIAPSKMSGHQYRSTIERLGLGGELLRHRQNGKTYKELSTIFGMSAETISRYFKYYDKCTPKEKLKLERTSIFDTPQQLENLNSLIQRTLARLEANNDEINVKVIGEQRQLIQLAATYAEKMANYQRYNQFMQIVYEILTLELPERQAEILHKISAASSMSSTSQLIDASTRSDHQQVSLNAAQ